MKLAKIILLSNSGQNDWYALSVGTLIPGTLPIESSLTAKAAARLLLWVHRVIFNVNSVIGGTHRGVSEKHLQSHLSEICYRFNRHFLEKELLDRYIQAC